MSFIVTYRLKTAELSNAGILLISFQVTPG